MAAAAAAVKDDSMNGPRKHETHKQQHSMGNEVILNAAIHGHGEKSSGECSVEQRAAECTRNQAPRFDESLFCEI